MTSLTDTQVVTASGGLVELGYQFTDRTNVAVSQTTLANATELVSTTVVCDGSPILIEFQCCVACASGEGVVFGVWVDGTFDSTFEANTNNQVLRMAYAQSKRVTPSAGSHTISIRWWRWTGSTLLTSLTGNAVLRVSKIVQATQWPAVTTGTIICTSTTRPASPFEGQTIYETDTKKELRWSGAAWLVTNYLTANWPSFNVFRVSTQTTTSTTVKFDNVNYDTGSNYSGSTGLFTAPVNGVYSFSAQTIYNQSQMAGTGLTWWFNKNGSRYLGASGYELAGNAWGTSASSITLPLVAGDTIGVYMVGGSWYGDGTYNHNVFTGHLVRPT
jgi:hypothetical protein